MDFELYNDDAYEKLKHLPDNSIDSVVTDPPYGIKFMSRKWDYQVPTKELWEEVLRVMKPGAHLLSFAGSRTYHRMVVNIEDAGFEIRDQLMWVYGSGFPKSRNVSKDIDKIKRVERQKKKVKPRPETSGTMANGNDIKPWIIESRKKGYHEVWGDKPITEESEQYDGWGTNLKPAHEPIVLARKPISEKTIAENVLKWGTGAINIDDCRVGDDNISIHNAPKGTFAGGEEDRGSDTTSYKNKEGRFPANFLHDGSDEVLKVFPVTTSGRLSAGHKAGNNFGVGNRDKKPKKISVEYGNDTGSAARFFYSPKASKKERNEGLEKMSLKPAGGLSGRRDGSLGKKTFSKNTHPTVKPVALIEYLITLITPQNETVLDPFTGSGTTGKAALRNGFYFIGIEKEEEYIEIARQRIEYERNDKTA